MNEPESKAERLLRLADNAIGVCSDLLDEIQESGSADAVVARQCRDLIAKYEYAKAAV